MAGDPETNNHQNHTTDAPQSDPLQPFVPANEDADLNTDHPDNVQLDSNGGPPPTDDDQPECPAITEWRTKFAKELEEKVQNERTVKTERAQKAKKTLESMHSKWDSKRKQAAEENQTKETEFIIRRDGVISRMSKHGEKPNWDIVPDLVDMTGKYKEGSRDTSRMRQVLLRMKNT